MRIAIVSPHILPFHSGNSLLADRLRRELSARGHHVAVFNAAVDSHEAAVSFGPDVLHRLHAVKTAGWTEKFTAGYQIPLIITLTGTDYNGGAAGSKSSVELQKNLMKASGLVVFHDEAYQSLETKYQGVVERVRVIPQGVEIISNHVDRDSIRAKYSFHEDDLVFIMVSGIRPVKNIGYGLDAFSEIRKQVRDARLLLLGPIMDENEADRVLAAGEQLRGFTYLGDRSPAEVRDLMSCADIFVNTSLNEGMSGAMLEAMAEGLPVLATRVAGNRSLIRDRENGLLVGLDNREELVRATLELAGNKSLRDKLGEGGKKTVLQYHSIEQEIDRYEALYRDLL
jgi:glycosyltransferase involved in cell wall biosynthesis